MIPVPGSTLATPYGRRGPYWSCDRDQYGNGIHTGADYPAPAGALVVAARPGQIRWTNHGSSFGNHQLEVVCTDGTRDFYAHMRVRSGEGDVLAGQRVGEVGTEGNSTGPHLHFERHAATSGPWSCDVVRDPQPSIDWQPEEQDDMTEDDWQRLRQIVRDEVQRARPDYVTSILAGEVDGRDDPTTVKKALRLSADAARDERSP
jgi:murein DD-endopeptidase MepM/ murein hydrolase activator NlpD